MGHSFRQGQIHTYRQRSRNVAFNEGDALVYLPLVGRMDDGGLRSDGADWPA